MRMLIPFRVKTR